MKTGAMM